MSDFTLTAIISARNEADIIGDVLDHLVRQRVAVYFIDDGSTDDTRAIVERFRGRGVIGIECTDNSESFRWAEILRRKEILSTTLPGTWFMHHDADEFRESPWPGFDLRDAVLEVDRLGYNAIAFEVLHFRPTLDDPVVSGPAKLSFYEPAEYWEAVQVKCWKQTKAPDLVSSGGHEVSFPDRRLFPIRFLTKHYPLRNQTQAEHKILVDRLPRFVPEERDRGWHVQYDSWTSGQSVAVDSTSLTKYEEGSVRLRLMLGLPDINGQARAEHAARELGRTVSELKALVSSSRADVEKGLADCERMLRELQAEKNQGQTLRAELQTLAQSHQRLSAELAGREAQCVELLAEVNREWRWKTEAFAALESERERHQNTYRDLSRAITALRVQSEAQLAQFRTELTEVQRQAEERRLEAMRLIGGLQHLRAELSDLRASWSWRLTYPLRLAARWLMPRPGAGRTRRD